VHGSSFDQPRRRGRTAGADAGSLATDTLIQVTDELRLEVLVPWPQSVLEHGCHLSFPTTAAYVRYQPWIQPVDATSWLNRSAGVRYSKVFLGRSFNLRATSLS
jgi:hypothetical protein